jgi:hypothetical protein
LPLFRDREQQFPMHTRLSQAKRGAGDGRSTLLLPQAGSRAEFFVALDPSTVHGGKSHDLLHSTDESSSPEEKVAGLWLTSGPIVPFESSVACSPG